VKAGRPPHALLAGALVALLTAGSGGGSAFAADRARGAELAAGCAGCHGENGNSETPATPSLAGHPAPYLTIQLILFREEQRRHEVMTPIAKGLTDDDIENLAAHYADQKRVRVEPSPAPASTGRSVSEAHRCGVCHLPDFSGREQIPRLSAQREDYLAKAMRDYKAGERSGVDGMMTGILRPIADEDLVALSTYLAGLP